MLAQNCRGQCAALLQKIKEAGGFRHRSEMQRKGKSRLHAMVKVKGDLELGSETCL